MYVCVYIYVCVTNAQTLARLPPKTKDSPFIHYLPLPSLLPPPQIINPPRNLGIQLRIQKAIRWVQLAEWMLAEQNISRRTFARDPVLFLSANHILPPPGAVVKKKKLTQ